MRRHERSVAAASEGADTIRGKKALAELRGAKVAGEDPDAGQTTIVLIGFALVTLLLVVTVMAVTSVYVGRQQLQSLADRAAGAAADTFTTVDRSGTGPPTPVLTNDAVAGSATSYLGTVGAFQDVSGLAVGAPTGSADGTTAQVTLTAVVHPPVVNVIVPAGIPISATGDARAVMRR
ncbi:pilus assembly protein TadG-related protein [Kocuria tytonicola]|uniref:pilus assembly protein TadG-related protein n=1 Tax=Kocuria tytonicola TaxID=2055946 RepID=UPI001FB52B8A|nr:pilus assembly protein TadG-related protein [Kocuria tytonicola]